MENAGFSGRNSHELARYIMERGKLIHDHVTRIFSTSASGKRKNTFLNLTVQQHNAVKAAWMHGDVTLTELSRILGVSPPSASVMVNRLVEKGILARERNAADRRKVIIRMAPEMIEDYQRMQEKVLDSFVDLVHEVGPETSRKWCEVLESVGHVLETHINRQTGES